MWIWPIEKNKHNSAGLTGGQDPTLVHSHAGLRAGWPAWSSAWPPRTPPPRLSSPTQRPTLRARAQRRENEPQRGEQVPPPGAVCWVSVCAAPAPKPRLPSAGGSMRTLVVQGPLSQAPCACALSREASHPGTLFPPLLESPARPLEPGSESPPRGGQAAGPGHPQSHPPELLVCGHAACGFFHP